MRHAAYLSTSRHGIFYFRWPIPPDLHPQGKRTEVKVSTGTRSPQAARQVSRLLLLAGQTAMLTASVERMRYDEIRRHVQEHFRDLLRQFREVVAERGPMEGANLEAMRGGSGLVDGDPEIWAEVAHPTGADGLLAAFCDLRGIKEALSPEDRRRMLAELQKGYRAYLTGALDHTGSFASLDLSDPPPPYAPTLSTAQAEQEEASAPYPETVERYFDEVHRSGSLAAKTLGDKEDALALLGEITGAKPVAALTRADARQVKDVLMRLPKNRRKSPQTRDLSLSEMLEVQGVERISSRTLNTYIGNMQTFLGWAVRNGYAEDNIFEGMRVRAPKGKKEEGRKPFSQAQLRTLYRHLTENPDDLVRKDTHKWATLIAMFSGMRLDEVAQLDVSDIQCADDVWFIDVNDDGERKHLKNASSHRRVPVHDRLLALGFLDFVESRRKAARLFPELSWGKNGYGRNIGRWFNESLLPKLGMKEDDLVFHSLRHSMITRLSQTDVPEAKVKAIVGHSQTGVTYTSYFREGFLPAQLRTAINKFQL
ncbi:tyrosine-type recombinase/integrase [Tranquillimonas rosea]|uniref:tyrosine-type recombinase/integrase n=1 Tax=Tranquillimonas rosea TaxID=641238 RepID=UPI003BAA848C